MIPGWILLVVSVGYVGLLFAVAWWGDRRPLYPARAWLRPLVYSLALAVYCSSWTFYGAVGTAARTGLGFLPIYLGPLLLLVFAWRLLERLALIARERNTVSIADFISARYGRAPALAALVAAIAVIAATPYVALQFKAVAMSLDVLAGTSDSDPATRSVLSDPALYVAAMLAIFAILFGTRRIDATEHHRGMMLAVALESLVKLIAFIAVGMFALLQLPAASSSDERAFAAARALVSTGLPNGFLPQTLLAFAAIICLPRQFQVAVVECEDVRDIRRARGLFSVYLILVCAMVIPIAIAGRVLVAGVADPDAYVLALPLAQGSIPFALVAYIGGLSAATGMVIVASVALATMVSNDLVIPLLFRRGLLRPEHGPHFGSRVLWIRRATIVAIACFAYSYYRFAGHSNSLAAYGLLAFAAVAQFAPALIGGLYWRGGSRAGALAGLCSGFSIWIYTLLVPALARSQGSAPTWLSDGPLGLEWLRPEALFGMHGWDAITHGTFWSLLANVGAFVIVSARNRPSFEERLLANPYLDPYSQRRAQATDYWHGTLTSGDLQKLAARVIGDREAAEAFAVHLNVQGRNPAPQTPADPALVQFTERLLAASIGAASARLTLTSALHGAGMELDEVVSLLDEAGQELRFNRQLLAVTIEKMAQGISVVNGELRLVAWNRKYQEMFDYPKGMLYVGRPVADLIRYNAAQGLLESDENVEAAVAKRLAHLRRGTAHVHIRERGNGRVIESRGEPLPGGGYVMTFNDISDYKRAERTLREANESLEQRVAERTREAEAAHASRSRFLAAISHDVLQPLHSARLFASALGGADDQVEQQRLAGRVDTALRAAEEMLDGLLDISRLDTGALECELSSFHLDELLVSVAEQYTPVAAARGLELRMRRCGLTVRSDRRLLRRALQNLVSNALRYTAHGGVLIGVRRRGAFADVQVWDTGRGIPPQYMDHIFEEFRRLEQPSPWSERGLGLGLAICERVSTLLSHPIDVRSRLGRGSMFAFRVPISVAPTVALAASPGSPSIPRDRALQNLRVLCLDNDREILDGMRALLSHWGLEVHAVDTIDEARELASSACPDILLVDYHLPGDTNGLDAIRALRIACGAHIRAALVTADGSNALLRAASEQGCPVLTKPVKPAALRALLAAHMRVEA